MLCNYDGILINGKVNHITGEYFGNILEDCSKEGINIVLT